jgi:predicted DCC family thiol-disulfide oxidoreductase YuxK
VIGAAGTSRHPYADSVPDDPRGLLVYDGSCGFCERSAQWIGGKWPPSGASSSVPWQQLGADRLAAFGLTLEDVARAAWGVEDGRTFGGHLAVAHALIAAGGGWRVVGRVLLVPPVRWLAAIVYRVVAAHRGRLPGHSPACRS